MKNRSEYVPPWVGPCGYCGRQIGTEDHYIQVYVQELTKEHDSLLFETIVCSDSCLENTIPCIQEPDSKLKRYSAGGVKPREFYLTEEGAMPFTCSYCGKEFREKDYHIQLTIQSDPGQTWYVVNIFCSKSCYSKAIGLGRRYVSLSLSAYSPENCIVEQLKQETSQKER